MRDKYLDLHTHSIYSDGLLSVKELVLAVKENGLDGFSLTDHDTVSGINDAFKYAEEAGIIFVPGIELSAIEDDREVHILGYNISTDMENELKVYQSGRVDRLKRMIEKLNELGIDIDFEEVYKNEESTSIGRPHIARVLIRNGVVKDIKEAFDLYLGEGKPAYVPKSFLGVEEALSLIRFFGGKAVLAHPGIYRWKNDFLLHVLSFGFDGIEVFYPEHSFEKKQYFLNLSKKYKIVPTGGSDFHGFEHRYSYLGEIRILCSSVKEIIGDIC